MHEAARPARGPTPSPGGGDRPRVLIVGGGFGGLAAARALARTHAHVVLFDRHNHHLFQPLLYQVATAALSPANIAAPIRRILRRQRNTEVVLSAVDGVDLSTSTVVLGRERYAYDHLIVAAGADTNYFGHDEWARVAPGLKTVDEALDVRSRFLLAFEQAEVEPDPGARRAALTFAIVGAGPTGVEMAGALVEIARTTLRRDFRHIDTSHVRVILIDALDRVLPTFTPDLSARARADLEGMGVEVMLETRVTDVDENGLTVEGAEGAVRIGANNVIWAAGVRAAAVSATLGVETDRSGRVVVGDDLSVSGHPNVFVVGDMALRVDPRTGRPVPGVAQGAIQMGRFAGRTVAAELEALRRGREAPARSVFVYDDRGSLATIGRNRAVAEIGPLRFGGVLAWLAWALVHVVFLIGFRRRVLAMAEWTWMYVTRGRGVRLITGANRMPRKIRLPPDPRLGTADRGGPPPVTGEEEPALLPLDGAGGLGGQVQPQRSHAGQDQDGGPQLVQEPRGKPHG